jgi:hypothetical protein
MYKIQYILFDLETGSRKHEFEYKNLTDWEEDREKFTSKLFIGLKEQDCAELKHAIEDDTEFYTLRVWEPGTLSAKEIQTCIFYA